MIEVNRLWGCVIIGKGIIWFKDDLDKRCSRICLEKGNGFGGVIVIWVLRLYVGLGYRKGGFVIFKSFLFIVGYYILDYFNSVNI